MRQTTSLLRVMVCPACSVAGWCPAGLWPLLWRVGTVPCCLLQRRPSPGTGELPPPGSLCLQAWPSQPLRHVALSASAAPGLRPVRVHGSRLGAPGSRLPLLQAVPCGPSAGSAVGAAGAGTELGGGARRRAQVLVSLRILFATGPLFPGLPLRARRAPRALVLPPTICGAPEGLVGTQPCS